MDCAPWKYELARQLRKQPTRGEAFLWSYLRRGGIGAKAGTQIVLFGYIADFYFKRYKLVVEVDGPAHDGKEQRAHDRERDLTLARHGIRTLRFKTDRLFKGIEGVILEIQEAIATLPKVKKPRKVRKKKVRYHRPRRHPHYVRIGPRTPA